MGAGAFFFQGVSVLLPEEGPAALQNLEIPLTYVDYFPASDIFTIPALMRQETISGVSVPPEAPLPQRWQAIPVRQILSLFADSPPGATGRLLRAFHIAQWRRESLFCGSCGTKNTDAVFDDTVIDSAVFGSADSGPARLCPSCGRMEFPRITPAVMVLITNDEGKALLAHNKKFVPGLYSIIAGFVEAGENLEAAAAREVREEVGIEIRNIQYAASQPWPFPHSLMVCFTADYVSGDIKPDGVEIEDAQWFSRGNLPKLPGPGSAALRLIQRWIEG